MKPKPINNPESEYPQILFAIADGIGTPKQLVKKLDVGTVKRGRNVGGNAIDCRKKTLSAELRGLKDLGFIKNVRMRSINHSSTSKYSVDFRGILNYLIVEYLDEYIPNKQDVSKIIDSKELQALLKEYFKSVSPEWEDVPGYTQGKIPKKITLKWILEQFVIGAWHYQIMINLYDYCKRKKGSVAIFIFCVAAYSYSQDLMVTDYSIEGRDVFLLGVK